MYLINGNFLLQYTIYIIIYRFLFLYYILYWQSFKDQMLRFFRNRMQNYCFSATWPNFLEEILHFLRNSLIFSTHFFGQSAAVFQYLTEHTLPFFRKRVQNYFFFMTWTNFYAKFLYFLRNALIHKNMLYNIIFGNDIHAEAAIQNYPISQLRDFLKHQRLSEGRAKDERRMSERRAVVNTTKMCKRNNRIAKN